MTHRIELQPGVWLTAIQTDRFKTGCFSINLMTPLREDTAACNALLPAVLLRGCRKYPDMTAVSQYLDMQYGAGVGTLIRKKGEVQTVGLYTDFLEDCFAGQPLFCEMMDFLRQLLFEACEENGGFVEEFTAGERQNLTNAIEARINDKRAYAVSRLLHHMCSGEPYAVPRIGYAKTIEAVTGQTLRAQYDRLLVQSPIELFYLGRQDFDTVANTLTDMLSGLPGGTRTVPRTDPSWHPHPVNYVQEQLDVAQGKLAIGFRTGITSADSRYPALMLLNAIFGGGMTSKLFLQLREARSLCYSIGSSVDKFKGIMLVDAGIEFDKYQVTLDGIQLQLDLCRRGEISEQELESARLYLLSGLRTAMDSPGRMDDFAVGQAAAGLDGSMEDLFHAVSALRLDDAVEAANAITLDTVYFLKGVDA